MHQTGQSGRRAFLWGCAGAGCACAARGATPSERNARPLQADKALPQPTGTRYDIAFCGIYCAACALHLQGKQDGKKCKGCTHPAMESKCGIFACAKERKVANCGLCPDFETCAKLRAHHEKPLYRQAARRTCTRVKEEGLNAASAHLKRRWTCPHCSRLYPWNTAETCPHCGKTVAGLSAEKDI